MKESRFREETLWKAHIKTISRLDMPKATTTVSVISKERPRHKPLSEDLSATGPLREKSKKRKAQSNYETGDNFIDPKSSRKILKIGQDLANEEHVELTQTLPGTAFTFGSRLEEADDSDEELRQLDEDTWGDDTDGFVEDVVSDFTTFIDSMST